ncbi:MAG: hypothetical protein VX239_01765, partial [Candidatus Thermoplasmatota archaeon]|nr:hypothetical protein [Candidatus Thermoplasmatota archaeon]
CMMLTGKRTNAYIGGHSRAQKVAERASGGSESNAISAGISTFTRFHDMFDSGIPGGCGYSVVRSDSTVAISAVQSGYSRAMYHLSKHAGTELAFLHDVFFPEKKDSRWLKLVKVASKENRADGNTKPLPSWDFEATLKFWGVCQAQ